MSKVFATKANLLHAKKSLDLAKIGYDLMDRKRNILIREMIVLTDKVKELRSELSGAYQRAYYYLQQANISLGVITDIARQVKIEEDIKITYRSVMGVEVPSIIYEPKEIKLEYGLMGTNSKLDKAYIQFQKVKVMTLVLVEVDNSVYRLAKAIKKTQKRANALKNVVIPRLEEQIKFISDSLEEKEREEFSRLKIIKKKK